MALKGTFGHVAAIVSSNQTQRLYKIVIAKIHQNIIVINSCHVRFIYEAHKYTKHTNEAHKHSSTQTHTN